MAPRTESVCGLPDGRGLPAAAALDRGQSTIELALTLPILTLVLVLMVEIAYGFDSYLTVVNSAHDGARLALNGATDSQVIVLVARETAALDSPVPSTCSASAPGICITHGTTSATPSIRVQVCDDHQLIIGVPGVLSGPLRFCSQTTLRLLG